MIRSMLEDERLLQHLLTLMMTASSSLASFTSCTSLITLLECSRSISSVITDNKDDSTRLASPKWHAYLRDVCRVLCSRVTHAAKTVELHSSVPSSTSSSSSSLPSISISSPTTYGMINAVRTLRMVHASLIKASDTDAHVLYDGLNEHWHQLVDYYLSDHTVRMRANITYISTFR
jgi:hypothetical protein